MSSSRRSAHRRYSASAMSTMSSSSREKHYVLHNYHDHVHDPVQPDMSANSGGEKVQSRRRKGHRGGVAVPFPEKLHYMLGCISKEGLDDVVRWQPHGRCFMVHKPKDFLDRVMPRYFRQSKLTSFQRQLNLYGFSRLTTGPDRGGYYHELFIRGRMDLCKRMVRTRVKGNGCKAASSPQTEPNFYTMQPCLGSDEVDELDREMYMEPCSEEGTSAASPRKTPDQTPSQALRVYTEEHHHEVVSASDESDVGVPPIKGVGMLAPRERSESFGSSTGPTEYSFVHPVSPNAVLSRGTVSRLDSVNSLCGLSIPMEISFPELTYYKNNGVHSGDLIFFEGLPFHYLETKDVDSGLLVEE